ncbi:alpha/beta fold hydrolase [Streptomyces sp. PU-14G]|uniref:alpha/beta fold hydrolase n=1 Tax=Streptomyces sp. PU-14G TaxID=2800808 RepID=UPI0034E02B0C
MSLAARVVGSGTNKVIMTHDWLVPTGTWSLFTSCLERTAFSWALLDARGYGTRRDVPGAYTMDELAGDLLALADQLGWEEFCLVGHSMGAKASQRVALDAPGRVRKLVGVTPTPAGPVVLTARQREMFTAAVESPQARRELLDLSTGNRASHTWLDRMADASMSGSAPAAFAAYARSFTGTDLTADLARQAVTVPVKVVAGRHDRAIPAHTLREGFAPLYPDLTWEVLADAGHYPMHEAPDRLAAALASFLRD